MWLRGRLVGRFSFVEIQGFQCLQCGFYWRAVKGSVVLLRSAISCPGFAGRPLLTRLASPTVTL